MAITPITCTDDIATCGAFSLMGGARLRGDDLGGNDIVTVYEERVDGGYEPSIDRATGEHITLTAAKPSAIFEGYGLYKCLGNRAGLAVGYAE